MSDKNISSQSPKYQEGITQEDLSHLEGEILTIIEAVVPHDKHPLYYTASNGSIQMLNGSSQIESVKSLIRASFSRQLSKLGVGRSA